ncbi:hypothetical protein Scep_021670 [Stephania cephalantha]|uniref:Uncharacterized protein n=1 Tax=Stephania cephalantha TaxID=152367 RepID=A0AAP0F3V6_9MAGN
MMLSTLSLLVLHPAREERLMLTSIWMSCSASVCNNFLAVCAGTFSSLKEFMIKVHSWGFEICTKYLKEQKENLPALLPLLVLSLWRSVLRIIAAGSFVQHISH